MLTFWDKLLIALTVGAGLASPAFVDAAVGPALPAAEVSVTVRGDVAQKLSLNQVERVRVAGVGGECVVETLGGEARVVESDCPKKLCQAMGPVGADGGIIICLPHRITISRTGVSRAEPVDAVIR